MSTRFINETALRISVPRDHEITSLPPPRAFATMRTPEILNTQGSPLLLFTNEPA